MVCRASLRLVVLLAVAALVRAQDCASITNATFGLNEGNGQANVTVLLAAAPGSTLRGYTFQMDLPADGTITVTRTRSAPRLSTVPAVGPVTTTWALQPLAAWKLTFYLKVTHWPNNISLSLFNGTSLGAPGLCLAQRDVRITGAATCSPTPFPTRAPIGVSASVGRPCVGCVSWGLTVTAAVRGQGCAARGQQCYETRNLDLPIANRSRIVTAGCCDEANDFCPYNRDDGAITGVCEQCIANGQPCYDGATPLPLTCCQSPNPRTCSARTRTCTVSAVVCGEVQSQESD
jgi:hypothetical protein